MFIVYIYFGLSLIYQAMQLKRLFMIKGGIMSVLNNEDELNHILFQYQQMIGIHIGESIYISFSEPEWIALSSDDKLKAVLSILGINQTRTLFLMAINNVICLLIIFSQY